MSEEVVDFEAARRQVERQAAAKRELRTLLASPSLDGLRHIDLALELVANARDIRDESDVLLRRADANLREAKRLHREAVRTAFAALLIALWFGAWVVAVSGLAP